MRTQLPKCKLCLKEFRQYNTLQTKCVECVLKMLKDGEIKPKKVNFKKVEKAIKKEQKEKLESYASRLKKAKVVFQKWCRLRDVKESCISCGTTYTDRWDGGHYLKAELYSGVIFDERNCSRQCVSCNKYKDGNVAAYRQHLVLKIGLKEVENLEQLANETRTKKWTDDELELIKTKYKL